MSDLENPFAPPEAAVVRTAPPVRELPWFPAGTNKVMVMTIATLGLYAVYWFERQYRFHNRKRQEKLSPLLRGLFSIFFAKDLFDRVSRHALIASVRVSWDPGSLAAVFIAFVIVDRIVGKMIDKVDSEGLGVALFFLSFGLTAGVAWPLTKVQGTINELLEKEAADFDRNETLTLANWVAIGAGALFVVMVIAGSFLPDA